MNDSKYFSAAALAHQRDYKSYHSSQYSTQATTSALACFHGEADSTSSNNHGRKEKALEKNRQYRRYEKPPYSYVGLIAVAIQSSPSKMLKLSEILDRISNMFPFFKGEYQGWRDSVRHNLSQNKCFKKVLPNPSRPRSKCNYWAVDVDLIPPEKLKRQNTSVSRNVAPGYFYARDLVDIFDLSTGEVKDSFSSTNEQPDSKHNQNCVDESSGFPVTSRQTWKASPNSTSQLAVEREHPSGSMDEDAEIDDLLGALPFWGKTCHDANKGSYDLDATVSTSSTETLTGNNPASPTMDVPMLQLPNAASKHEVMIDLEFSEKESMQSEDSSVPTDSSDTDSNNTHFFAGAPESSATKMKKFVLRNSKSVQPKRNKRKIRSAVAEEKSVKNPVDLPVKRRTMVEISRPTTPLCGVLSSVGNNKTEISQIDTSPSNQILSTTSSSLNTEQLASVKPRMLCPNIDQTVGPDGPPNVTWRSSVPLDSVRDFFLPSEVQETQSAEVFAICENQLGQNSDISFDARSAMARGEFYSSTNPQPSFRQQELFLTEQASIISGRGQDTGFPANPYNIEQTRQSLPPNLCYHNANIHLNYTPSGNSNSVINTWENCAPDLSHYERAWLPYRAPCTFPTPAYPAGYHQVPEFTARRDERSRFVYNRNNFLYRNYY